MMLLGLFPLVPAVLILTLSFFVLVTVSKIDSKALQSFGRILAAVLCIFAALAMITHISFSIGGRRCRFGVDFPFKPQLNYPQMMR